LSKPKKTASLKSPPNDPDLFMRKAGAAEALEQAKRQGKVRFVGFTGHKDPSIHLKMLRTGFPFDSVQMPLNPFDATFRSYRREAIFRCLSGVGETAASGVMGYPIQARVRDSIAGCLGIFSLYISSTVHCGGLSGSGLQLFFGRRSSWGPYSLR
jgi:predicted oxidoreductase